jgi:hypothetical protein
MQKSYKFTYIKREDDVHISEALVRFYEGDFRLVDKFDSFATKVDSVSQYVPTKKLEEKIYTDKDFGIISDTDELRVFLNDILSKDKTRTPIAEQFATNLIQLKSQLLK